MRVERVFNLLRRGCWFGIVWGGSGIGGGGAGSCEDEEVKESEGESVKKVLVRGLKCFTSCRGCRWMLVVRVAVRSCVGQDTK